jgi:hypothetical protein
MNLNENYNEQFVYINYYTFDKKLQIVALWFTT